MFKKEITNKSLYEQFRNSHINDERPSYGYSPEKLAKLVNEHPELRFRDNPADLDLIQMAVDDPANSSLQEALSHVIDDKNMAAILADDHFHGNYPSVGSLQYPSDFIALGRMPTQDEIGVTASQCVRNMLFVGPTGSAKTSLLKMLISDPKLITTTRVVVFGKKRDLRGLLNLIKCQGCVVIFQLEELKLSFSQPPGGVKDRVWHPELAVITGHCYRRLSAQRLMAEKFETLCSQHTSGLYPTLAQLIEVLEKMRPHPFSREFELKESIVSCLKDLYRSCGSIFEYGSSNFLEVLFSTPGLAVIELETLGQEALAWLVTYFARWIYCKRIYEGH